MSLLNEYTQYKKTFIRRNPFLKVYTSITPHYSQELMILLLNISIKALNAILLMLLL